MKTFQTLMVTWLALTMLICATGAARAADYTTDPVTAIGLATPWPGTITIGVTDPVTKANYLTTANHFCSIYRSWATSWTANPPTTTYWNLGSNLNNAYWLARMYYLGQGQAGDDLLAYNSVRDANSNLTAYNNPADPRYHDAHCFVGIDTAMQAYFIDKWLTGSPYYTTQLKSWLQTIATAVFPSYANSAVWAKEYGAMNRSFGCAMNAECFLALATKEGWTAPDAASWRTYIDTVWNYWYAYPDVDENTDHYETLDLRYILPWVEVRGITTSFWANTGIQRMMERYLYHVTPMGGVPHYGDTDGWNETWGHMVYLFETCAANYQDGRYKQAAHRIYDYGINRIQNLDSWSYTGSEAGWSLLQAWAIADDTIMEANRDKEVALTLRHTVTQNADPASHGGRYCDVGTTLMPDKLIFTSGSDKTSMSMTVEGAGIAGHSHRKPGMTVQLSDQQSVLLMALGYMERLPEDHARSLLMDFDGYKYDNTAYYNYSQNDTVSSAHVYELGGVGYGTLQVTQYQGYPATLDRDIVFIKGVGAVVKDRVTMTSLTGETDIWLRWGNLYRVANVGPDYGNNWINSYTGEWLPVRGSGNPNGGVYAQWHNSKRDVLLYFLPNDSGSLEVVDKKQLPDGTNLDSTLPLRWQVQYSVRQTTGVNAPVAATTLLLPHASGAATTLAGGVSVAHDDAQYTIFTFTDVDGATQHSVVINRSGGAVNAGGLDTDAQIAYVKRNGGGTVLSVARYGGTYVKVNTTDYTSLAAASKEQVAPDQVISLGYLIPQSNPAQFRINNQYNNNVYTALAPFGITMGMGTSYNGGNSIGIDWDPNTASSRWDLDANHYFPTTATVGPSTTKPSWWTFGANNSSVVSTSPSGYCNFVWNTRHYALPILDGRPSAGNLPKSCTITIVPTSARASKKIAVLAVNGGYATVSDVTVNYIKIGGEILDSTMFPVSIHNPGTLNNSVVAYGFSVPVIPGKNIEINVTLENTGNGSGVALAMEQ